MTKKLSGAHITTSASLVGELTYYAIKETTAELKAEWFPDDPTKTPTGNLIVKLSGSFLTVNLGTLEIPWTPEMTYRIEVDEGYCSDAGNRFYPSLPPSPAYFTANPLPLIISTNPVIGSITDNNATLEITFDRPFTLVPYRKKVYLYKITPGGSVLVRYWDSADDDFRREGNTLIYTTKGRISSGTQYYVLIDNGLVYDDDNFVFPGISSPTTFTFTSVGEPQFPDLIAFFASSGTMYINEMKLVRTTASTQVYATLTHPGQALRRGRLNATVIASIIILGGKNKQTIAPFTSIATVRSNAGKAAFMASNITSVSSLSAQPMKLKLVNVNMTSNFNVNSNPIAKHRASISLSSNFIWNSSEEYYTPFNIVAFSNCSMNINPIITTDIQDTLSSYATISPSANITTDIIDNLSVNSTINCSISKITNLIPGSLDLVVTSSITINPYYSAFMLRYNVIAGTNRQVRFTLYGQYNFTVDWGDGTTESYISSDYDGSGGGTVAFSLTLIHNYTTTVTKDYDISFMRNTTTGINLNSITPQSISSAAKLTSVLSFGNLGVRKVSFQDSSYLVSVPTYLPNTIIQLMSTFQSCPLFNDSNVTYWDTSNVQRMDQMFGSSNFNQNIGNWNVSNVQYFDEMFTYSSFNQDIGNWNVSNARYMTRMFYNNTVFNQNLTGWCVQHISTEPLNFGGSTSWTTKPIWGTCP